MFKNNLKIAWRSLINDRQFTFLNLLGLATGLTCTILIYLWVHDEYQFDKFHEKDARLYQLMEHGQGRVKYLSPMRVPDFYLKLLQRRILTWNTLQLKRLQPGSKNSR